MSTAVDFGAKQSLPNHLLDGLTQFHRRERLSADPAHIANVAARAGFSGDRPAEIIYQNVMVLGAA